MRRSSTSCAVLPVPVPERASQPWLPACAHALWLCLALGAAADSAAAQRQIDERHAAPATGAIRIHVYSGTLRVIGWSSDTIAVTGTVREAGSDRFYMGVSPQGTKLGIWPQQTDTLPPSQLELHVPRNSSVWIKTVTADVHVEALAGSVDVYSVGGRIDVAGAPRDLYAETMAGAIVADVSTRSARLRTASGMIALRGRIADAAAQSVSGAIEITGNDIERGRFESVDGDVVFRGRIQRAASLDFINHSGTVRLAIPSDTRADVLVSTYGGELHNAFAARVTESSNRFKGSEYVFVLGGGGGQIAIRTFDGDVFLTSQ